MTNGKNQLVKVSAQELLSELNDQFTIASKLRSLPAFSKYSDTDLLTIVHAAQFLGLSPLVCLQGGLYAVGGKVELSSAVMNRLIRQAGHQIEADPNNNETICTLKGIRADGGAPMIVSYSMDEAKRAGLANKGPWRTYPADMLFARCLSRLGRRLFPDVLQGCYVEGEISQKDPEELKQSEKTVEVEKITYATAEEVEELWELLKETPEFAEELTAHTRKLTGDADVSKLPQSHVQCAIRRAKEIIKENENE